MKQTMQDQSYHAEIIAYLHKFLSNNTCEYLLLGSEDPEILSTYSLYDRTHVTTKTRHIIDALIALYDATEKGMATVWLRCCDLSIEKNHGTVKRVRPIADWYIELHKTSSLKF